MPEELTPRQIAGREARKRRKGLTPEGRERLREAALRNRPWEHSTGPRTWRGKRVVRQNALVHGSRAFTVLPAQVRAFITAVEVAEAGGPLPAVELVMAAADYFGKLPNHNGVRLEGLTRFLELMARAEQVRRARA